MRAHVFLCMLACHVGWHMRRALAPLLFDDHEPPEDRSLPVEPARRSRAAIAKANSRRTADGFPVHSFQTLLADLATLTRNQVRLHGAGGSTVDLLARPTPLQSEAFRLLRVRP